MTVYQVITGTITTMSLFRFGIYMKPGIFEI